jgi:hypothetical protein
LTQGNDVSKKRAIVDIWCNCRRNRYRYDFNLAGLLPMRTLRIWIDNVSTHGLGDADLVEGVKDGFRRWVIEARSYGFRPNIQFEFVDGRPFNHRVRTKTIWVRGNHYRGQADLPGNDIYLHSGIAPPGTHDGTGTKLFKPLTSVGQVSKIVRHEFGHNFGLRHSGFTSCAMHSNSSSNTICKSEAQAFVDKFGEVDKPPKPEPKLPTAIEQGTKIKALNVVEVNKGSLVLESGERVYLAGHRIVVSDATVIIHEPPASEQPNRSIAPVECGAVTIGE